MDWLLRLRVGNGVRLARIRNCNSAAAARYYARMRWWLREGAPTGLLWCEVQVTDCVRLTAGSFVDRY